MFWILQAYKKVADDSKSLPGLTDYTSDQLFFIAFSQVSNYVVLPMCACTCMYVYCNCYVLFAVHLYYDVHLLQLWCSYTTKVSFETSVYTDVHSPDPIR